MTRISARSTGIALGSTLILSSIFVMVPAAQASASGCTVNRYVTPPSTHYNTGSARCVTLNGGTRMRVEVTCSAFQIGYGPWVTKPNTNSVYVCPSVPTGNYPDVGYQT